MLNDLGSRFKSPRNQRQLHRFESEALARRHAREKRDIERRRRTLARLKTRERQSLEKAIRREQRLQGAARLERDLSAEALAKAENMGAPRARRGGLSVRGRVL
jgi:hypothetical protein